MYIIDSNILIGHLNGDVAVKKWIKENIQKEELYISTIARIEVLSFPGLSDENLYEAEKFLDLFHEIGLYGDIISMTADIKRNAHLPLADSIILATTVSRRMTLVTNDKELIKKAKNLVEVLTI
jgi:predicted nucleic acid-binding protein